MLCCHALGCPAIKVEWDLNLAIFQGLKNMEWDDDDEGFFDAVDQLVEQHKQSKVPHSSPSQPSLHTNQLICSAHRDSLSPC